MSTFKSAARRRRSIYQFDRPEQARMCFCDPVSAGIGNWYREISWEGGIGTFYWAEDFLHTRDAGALLHLRCALKVHTDYSHLKGVSLKRRPTAVPYPQSLKGVLLCFAFDSWPPCMSRPTPVATRRHGSV